MFAFIPCFLSFSDSIELVRFNRLKLFETETEPDRVVFLFFNRFIWFFLSVRYFWLIFFRFNRLVSFFEHP
jgi:hypothetical protein